MFSTEEHENFRGVVEADGEYEVIGRFFHKDEPVKIVHLECNTRFEEAPRRFFKGFKCPKCK